jgi:hypothetical protein
MAGGDNNQLIRNQNQGVRPTLVIRRNPLCPLGFRLSLVRTVRGRFSSCRGPNADQGAESWTGHSDSRMLNHPGFDAHLF